MPLDALTEVLSAAFDKAALAIISGKPIDDYKEALRILCMGIAGMNTKTTRGKTNQGEWTNDRAEPTRRE